MNTSFVPNGYADWLIRLKQRIQGARQRALLAANEEQIRLYHDIGREILERQNQQGWGQKSELGTPSSVFSAETCLTKYGTEGMAVPSQQMWSLGA